MVYSLAKIRLLTKALKGDKQVYSQLMREAPEYAALGSALVENTPAMNWLLKNHAVFAAFVDAVHENKSAIQILLKEKHYELAAVSNMLNNDAEAELWLEKHNLKDYIDFAVAIQYALDRDAENNYLGRYFTLYG